MQRAAFDLALASSLLGCGFVQVSSSIRILAFEVMVMAKFHGVHYSCGSTPLLGAIASVGVPAEKCTPRNFAITR